MNVLRVNQLVTEAWVAVPGHAAYAIALQCFLFNLALVLTAFLIGAGLMAALLKATRSTENRLLPGTLALLAISTGLAVMLAELFGLALFQLMTPVHVLQLFATTGSVALCLCLCWRARLESAAGVARPHSRFVAGVTLAFMGVLAVMQFSFIDIANGYDSTAFHVPYADVFVKHHGLAVDEHLIYPYHSFNINLLFSLALMIEHNIIYVQTVHSLFATLAMFGVYQFCRESGQRLWLAIILALGCAKVYVVDMSRTVANVDLGAMFFVFMAVFALYLWSSKRQATWLLICSAIAFGIAMGSKYIIVVIALPIALCIAWQAGKQFYKPLLMYMAWAAAFGLWWYIRNWMYTGNPVHPFATSVFGYYLWDKTDMASQMEALQQAYVPRDLRFLPLVPLNAYYSTLLRTQGAYLVIWMLYASTLLTWLLAWRDSRQVTSLLLCCWIYFISWLFGSQDPRHLMPIIPLVFVYTGATVDRLCSSVVSPFAGQAARLSWSPAIARAMSVLLVLLSLLYGLHEARNKFLMVSGRPLQVGAAQDAALRQNPVIDLFFAANEAFRATDTILELGMREGRWFFNGHVVGNPFGPHSYTRVMNKARRPDGSGIAPELLEKVLTEDYHAQGFVIPNDVFAYTQSEFDAYFEVVYRNKLGSVYRLRNH